MRDYKQWAQTLNTSKINYEQDKLLNPPWGARNLSKGSFRTAANIEILFWKLYFMFHDN